MLGLLVEGIAVGVAIYRICIDVARVAGTREAIRQDGTRSLEEHGRSRFEQIREARAIVTRVMGSNQEVEGGRSSEDRSRRSDFNRKEGGKKSQVVTASAAVSNVYPRFLGVLVGCGVNGRERRAVGAECDLVVFPAYWRG